MSQTQVFIIRLFINRHTPGFLRGSVESINGGELQMFTDGQSLLKALSQLALSSGEPPIVELHHDSPEEIGESYETK
jgi:hypothetical protein